MENQKNNPSYLKLAQFYQALHAKLPQNCIETIINQIPDINYQIPATTINNSALHLAFAQTNLEAFNLLLQLHADITSKTPTIVHLAIEKNFIHRELSKLNDLATYVFFYFYDRFVADEISDLVVMRRVIENYDKNCDNWRLPRELKDSFVDSVLEAQVQREDPSNPRSDNGLTHFHAACLCNNVRAAEFFLEHGVNVNEAVNFDSPMYAGFTPLHLASDWESVDLLVKYGADVQLKNAAGLTARQLVLNRNLKIAERTSYINTLPYRSCFNDYLQNEKMLVAMLDHTDETGLSPLHVACTLNDTSVVRRLLEKGANVDERVAVDSPLYPGFSALHFAAIFNIETAKLLLESGADIETKDAKEITAFDICASRATIPDLQFIISRKPSWKSIILSDGKTLLTDLLSGMENLNKLRDFLEITDPNVFVPLDSPLWPGLTILHLSVLICESTRNFNRRYCYDMTNIDTPNTRIELWLWRNADVNARDARGWTPIHLAFRLRNLRAVNLLLKLGGNRIDNNSLHLHVACAARKPVMVEHLICNGADVNSRCSSGSTPLHVAASAGCLRSVKILLKYGADVNVEDADGLTPIHRNHTLVNSSFYFQRNPFEFSSIGRELLSSASLRESIVENSRLSHLHVATFRNDVSAMEKLLAMGSDVNLVDRGGETPLMMARSKRAEGLLIGRGADVFAKRSDGACWLMDRLKSPIEGRSRIIGEMLRNNEGIEERALKELGWTLLHVNCRLLRSCLFKKSTRKEIDVNARIPDDSPVFPGCTALHVLVASSSPYMPRKKRIVWDRIFRELVENEKVDVTVTDVSGNTAMHMADYCSRIVLLHRLTNFNVNPTNHRGESTFHLACLSQDPSVVEQYLKAGVKVNEPTDFFVVGETAGYTSLHLAVRYRMCSVEGYNEKQVQVVELLLEYGADVRAVGADGNTPLHVAAGCAGIDTKVLEMIVEAGADLNAVNVRGETPLEILLEQFFNRVACNKKIEFFIRRGCRMNAYNPVTRVGYLSRAFSYKSMDDRTFKAMMSCTSVDEVDELGRTAIHNIVSTTSYKEKVNTKVIGYLIGRGCDVDGQDECGKTALHLAAQFGNLAAVEALLLYGADLNITDIHGKTAFTYTLESTEASHEPTIERLARHVFYLELYGLHVDASIKRARTSEAFDRVKVKVDSRSNCKFISRMELIKIKSTSLTLDDFMSETGAVTSYRKMPKDVRKAVDEFFASACEKLDFRYAKYLCKLQLRKAEKRIGLVESARKAMNVLLRFQLPELCFDAVERFLSNADLERLVRSVG